MEAIPTLRLVVSNVKAVATGQTDLLEQLYAEALRSEYDPQLQHLLYKICEHYRKLRNLLENPLYA